MTQNPNNAIIHTGHGNGEFKSENIESKKNMKIKILKYVKCHRAHCSAFKMINFLFYGLNL